MNKIFIKITIIIFLNLFAFLLFGSILGAIFWNFGLFLIWAVIFSLITLTIILFIEIKKTLNDFNSINTEKNEWNSK